MEIKKRLFSCLVIVATLTRCTNGDAVADRQTLLASDYQIFQGTIAWDLAKAVQDDDADKIKQIVNKNKRLVSVVDPRYGQTLLALAVYNEKYNSCKALVEVGADPNQFNNYDGQTPLMKAAGVDDYYSGPDPRYLSLLLKYGGKPNLEQKDMDYNHRGQTPLSIACSLRKSLACIKVLVNAGADVNYKSETSASILSSAMLSENPDLVIYLIQKGIDYKQPMRITEMHKRKYITDDLRYWRFDLGSEDYIKKMLIIDFLKRHGMDYRKTKIPDNYYNLYDKNYLDKY
jgi:hypothetical protein